jgi:hypothetical protein
MAGNTKCYRVTVGADGRLAAQVWEFSPRFCDSIPAALERLSAEGMGPAMVRFGDWEELQRRWNERREEVQP